jgi:ATP-dependent Zn protease
MKHNSNRHHMRAAHHEAGHAVTALLLDMGLEYATIEGYPLQSAVTQFDPGYTGNENPDDPAVREKILKNVVVALAGIAADAEFFRIRGVRHEGTGTTDDKMNAVGMIAWLYTTMRTIKDDDVSSQEERAGALHTATNADLAACEMRARTLIRENWAGLHRVAKELCWRKLTADEIRRIFDGAPA